MPVQSLPSLGGRSDDCSRDLRLSDCLNRMGTSFRRQLQGVLWKNLLLKRAHIGASIFEVSVAKWGWKESEFVAMYAP